MAAAPAPRTRLNMSKPATAKGAQEKGGPEQVHQPPPMPEVYACPICGGRVHEEHGVFHCERCGQVVEACCEGAPPSEG